MDRRDFLKHASLSISGIIAAHTLSPWSHMLFAATHGDAGNSLSLITDTPDRTIELFENMLRRTGFIKRDVRCTVSSLPGEHVSEIVVIRENRIIDYRAGKDAFSREVAAMARRLGYPRRAADPVFIRFAGAAQAQQPAAISIYHENRCVARLALDNEQSNFFVSGAKGGLSLQVKDRQAKIVSASCKHKTCMKMGSIRQAGQTLVCIPNRIRIKIDGKDATGIDATAF